MTDTGRCSGYNKLLRSISLKDAYEFVMESLKAEDSHRISAHLWHLVPYCKVNGRYLGEKVPGYKVMSGGGMRRNIGQGPLRDVFGETDKN